MEQFDISIEEFDSLNGEHEFSDKYKKNKKELLREYRKRIYGASGKKYKKAAVAAALLIISAPVITNAATDGGFFNRIWGSAGKENIEPHAEVLYDREKGTSCTVTYPKQEYEDIDPAKAEELIGDNISYNPVVKKLGDTKLSVLSFVHDGNAAVAEFTLERKGGVDALVYSKGYNETKGADFSGESTFYFDFGDYNGKIYVDLDKSEKDLLYCYYYMTAYSGHIDNVELNIEEYPCTRKELWESDGSQFKEYMDKTKKSTITVPSGTKADKSVFVNKGNGTIEISPLSMKIDMKKGLGLSEEEAYDPYNAYYVVVNYKDGTKYVVHEHEMDKIHSCPEETDNASYTCGTTEDNLIFVFNRLVDTGNIQSVTVNKAKYKLKN